MYYFSYNQQMNAIHKVNNESADNLAPVGTKVSAYTTSLYFTYSNSW